MVDYIFGKGVSKAFRKDEDVKLVYSRRSGRVKLAYVGGHVFATVKPNGSMALTMHGASILMRRRANFMKNCIVVEDDTAEFVKGGKSVFCKFVRRAGENIYPKSETVVLDSHGRLLGVGMAVIAGKFMTQFSSGVAVKVRTGSGGPAEPAPAKEAEQTKSR
jgi:predicted RNA-binding protein (TIGR00451 family)